jgi:flagellar hook-associated protein 3 FlgL
MHDAALATMMARSSELTRTQTQIASGRRVNTPADDPVAAVHILEIERALQESEQYARNANMATNRLSLEEQSLADAGNLLQRVRDLAVQANGGTLDAASLEAIAVEVESRLDELMQIANRRDAAGEYLFAGYSTLTQPFSRSGSSVLYSGDHGERLLQLSATQRIADGHSGFEVFQNVVEGNGTFVTSASNANTGTGTIDTGTLTDPLAWGTPDTYTVRFTSATDWEVLDSTNTVVANGVYTSNSAIAFRGVQVTIAGEPAANDEFTVRPSAAQDMFTTLNRMLTTLRQDSITGADNARFSTQIGTTLQQLDQALDHLGNVRAEVGARLSAVETAENSREDREIDLQKSLSELRDLDYAEAITRLNQQLVGLQAAQASYTRIAGLSLFNYL